MLALELWLGFKPATLLVRVWVEVLPSSATNNRQDGCTEIGS